MSKYSSKTQSKNGGRRRKQTKRKLHRGRKSRKVMRGGAPGAGTNAAGREDIIDYDNLITRLLNVNAVGDSVVEEFLDRYSTIYQTSKFKVNGKFLVLGAFAQDYNLRFNEDKPETLYKYVRGELIKRLGVDDAKNPKLIKLQTAINSVKASQIV